MSVMLHLCPNLASEASINRIITTTTLFGKRGKPHPYCRVSSSTIANINISHIKSLPTQRATVSHQVR